MYEKLRLLRNHGLSGRDEVLILGQNTRLPNLQAVIGNRLLNQVHPITDQRIANAQFYDNAFSDLSDYLTIPRRDLNVKQVYHTYVLRAVDRNGLLKHLQEHQIEAKVHYPIPLHLQQATEHLGYKKGDFPVCENHCESIITLPVHQHLREDELQYVSDCVREFYLA